MELVQDRSRIGFATLSRYQVRSGAGSVTFDKYQGRMCDVNQIPGSFQGMSVVRIGFATLQGRDGGLFGSGELTFCYMKRSTCRHRSPPKTSEAPNPEALL